MKEEEKMKVGNVQEKSFLIKFLEWMRIEEMGVGDIHCILQY